MKPPNVSSRECVRTLERAGYTVERIKGSHIRLQRAGQFVTVPHARNLQKGTMAHILRVAGVKADEFEKLRKG